MERLSTIRNLGLVILAGVCLIGCSGDVSVSNEDEKKFKNPNKEVDWSKVPKNLDTGRPSFVGEPSGPTSGSLGGGSAPPPGVIPGK